jgi:hypothetical protein
MIDFHVYEARKARRVAAMVKKLSKGERLVDEQMLALLEWASDHPGRWHDIGTVPATQKAARLLAERGVIEICLAVAPSLASRNRATETPVASYPNWGLQPDT